LLPERKTPSLIPKARSKKESFRDFGRRISRQDLTDEILEQPRGFHLRLYRSLERTAGLDESAPLVFKHLAAITGRGLRRTRALLRFGAR